MLDARVYCNCVEASRLRVQPQPQWRITILEDGSLEADCLDEREAPELRRWWEMACEHQDRQLVYHCLGNVGMISFLREEFGRVSEKCPLLLGRVVCDGIHGGDFLTVEQVRELDGELSQLESFRCEFETDQFSIDHFLEQMRELVAAALSVNKPIAF